jgi:ParB family chromosome partitioning protein
MQSHSIRVDDIVIGERHRALSEDAVQRLAGSMKDIGLLQPVTVRIADEMMLDGELTAGVPVLVAGGHRLAAAKQLGWSHVDCVEVADDDITAELCEIAENLHRHDLTKDQRDQHIRRYAELLERRAAEDRIVPQNAEQMPRPRGRPVSVTTQIAEATGLSDDTVRRALNPKPTPRPQLVEVKDDYDVIGAQADAIVRAWNRACPEARALAMEQIEGPVMDHAMVGAVGR